MSDSGKSPCNSNRVCQILKIEKPVIQGPMFWLTDAKLVAGVSEAGGLGVLGPHAGQNSLPKDDAERAERMRAEIKKVKELTSKPFGINIIVTDKKPDVQLELMLKVVYEEKGNGFETVPRRVPVPKASPENINVPTLHLFFLLLKLKVPTFIFSGDAAGTVSNPHPKKKYLLQLLFTIVQKLQKIQLKN